MRGVEVRIKILPRVRVLRGASYARRAVSVTVAARHADGIMSGFRLVLEWG